MCFSLALLLASVASAGVRFASDVLGRELDVELHPPARLNASLGPTPAVVYLQHLPLPRLGQVDDRTLIDALNDRGFAVLVVYYQNDPRAKPNAMAADILKLRRELPGASPVLPLPDLQLDPARFFILPAGYELRTDVPFAVDGDRLLQMDIAFPAEAETRYPLLIEFSCDNVHRMGSASLLFCHDTLLETSALYGFAVAMADHPVRPPFKGIDGPMPASLEWARSAVTTARSLSSEIPLSGRVGVMGFSRGATYAAMLACGGDVDAALVHGNRFDYLNLRIDDPMRQRFEQAWGPLPANERVWASRSAITYLNADRAAPMFLSTSDTESPEYRHGLEQLRQHLADAGVRHVHRVDPDGRGHRVTTDPDRLAEIFEFFRVELKP